MSDVATHQAWFSLPADPAIAEYERVQSILSEEDPEGFLRTGAPPPQYRPEAEDITERLMAGEIVDAASIIDMWDYWFGGHGLMTRAMAKRIARKVNQR